MFEGDWESECEGLSLSLSLVMYTIGMFEWDWESECEGSGVRCEVCIHH